MQYELMELTTGNIVGVYATEEEALRDVAETVRLYGPAAVATLALGADDYPNSPGHVVADGLALVELARRLDGRSPANGPGAAKRPARTKPTKP